MTTKEKLESMLVATGMFESQAKEVIGLAIPELNKQSPGGYKITWDLPASGYPDMLYNLWFITVKKVALPWIDKNCPNAWFRPVFDDKQMEEMKSKPIIDSKLRTAEDQKILIEEANKSPYPISSHIQQSSPIPETPNAVHVDAGHYTKQRTKKKVKKNPPVQFQYRRGYAIVNGVSKKATTRK